MFARLKVERGEISMLTSTVNVRRERMAITLDLPGRSHQFSLITNYVTNHDSQPHKTG